jgi:hypothetical protein
MRPTGSALTNSYCPAPLRYAHIDRLINANLVCLAADRHEHSCSLCLSLFSSPRST